MTFIFRSTFLLTLAIATTCSQTTTAFTALKPNSRNLPQAMTHRRVRRPDPIFRIVRSTAMYAEDDGYADFLEQKKREDVITSNPIFKELPKGDRARLVAVMETLQDLPMDEPIVKQGDKGDSMYFVKSGRFECTDEKTGEVLRTCKAGDAFGELSLLYNSPRAATVRPVSDDAELWMISREDFDKSVDSQKGKFQNTAADDENYSTYFENKKKRAVLKKCVLFKKLLPDDAERIIRAMETVPVKAGEVVIKQGDEGSEMYFVREGSFDCYDETTGKVLTVCEEGDFFGELALLLRQERAVSVRAAANSTSKSLWALRKEDFIDAVQDSPLFNSILETVEEKYQVDNAFSLLTKLKPGQLYDLLVASSRPKKEPVSFHSLLATVSTGLFSVLLVQEFCPGIYPNGLPRIFEPELYTAGEWHAKLTGLLFALIAVTGIFRLPPNTPTIRRALFTQCAAQTVLTFLTLDSVIWLRDESVWTLDLMHWSPATIGYWAFFVIAQLFTGELISQAIGAPEKGRSSIPFNGNPIGVSIMGIGAVTGSFFNLPRIALAQDMDALQNIWVPFSEVSGGASLLVCNEAYCGMGMLVATLLFEKKISQQAASMWLGATLFLTGFYDVAIGKASQFSIPAIHNLADYDNHIDEIYHIEEFKYGLMLFFIGRGFWLRFNRSKDEVAAKVGSRGKAKV